MPHSRQASTHSKASPGRHDDEPTSDPQSNSDSSLEDMAPLLRGGFIPSQKQREHAEHFGHTGDVFDLLGL